MGLFEKFLIWYWKVVEKKDNTRLAAQKAPDNIKVISDIPYQKGEKPNLLDIYYPEGTTRPLPVIVEVHGGGWMYGSKELNKYYAMNLAARGFVVVNLNYRLVQEERYPAQIKDIFAALNWMEKHSKEYFMDLDNVFITGDSAGAHLSSVILALQYNEEARKALGVKSSIKIKGGGLICGAFDFDIYRNFKALIIRLYLKVMLGEKKKGARYEKMLSFKDVYAGEMPPIYLMTSREDFIREQTMSFVDFCKEKKIEHKFRYLDKDGNNKLVHVFNVMYPHYEESISVNDEMCEFFRDLMK